MAQRSQALPGCPNMKRMVRANAIALVWFAATAACAGECRIGPAAFEAPACDIREMEHADGPARYVQWQEGGILYEVSVIAPYRPRSFRGHVSRWRHSHKCTAEEVPFEHMVRVAASGGGKPPQATWKGVCADCGSYVMQATGLKRQVVELHAGRRCGGLNPPPSEPPLEVAFAAFLGHVQLLPGD